MGKAIEGNFPAINRDKQLGEVMDAPEQEQEQEQPKKVSDKFHCVACGCDADADVLPMNLAVFAGTNALAPFTVLICPNCYTLQILKEVYDQIVKQAKSKIIIP